ncbi:MAG: PorP/SprF family type IX secretion system membrane protein [Bacteroidetes bacterium]|jgi:type IX secretion system PorP/SprF family membrane protein|nr:PorP/SprF family type IX secretion system membrane protein [Bacteroidota bacterium]
MKKNSFLLISFFSFIAINFCFGQQLPDYTQYPSMLWQLNPAYTGTKSNIDARINYRKQWVGYDGAPVTQFAGLSSRLWKGRIGVGATMYKDVTGPSERSNYGFTAAYHLRFPDVEFSIGMGVNFNKYTINGPMMTTHWTGDPAVDISVVDYDKTKNAMAGLLLYNDRFHFGLGVVNIADNKAQFYIADTAKYSQVTFAQHFYFTCGYNFNANPAFVWENNLMALYVSGLPMTINYNLRVHYKEKIIAGAGWRLKDDIYLQAGYVFLKSIQLLYSYDIGISNLQKGHSGSHEVMIGYRWDLHAQKGNYKGFQDFQKQRYHIF